MSYGVAGSRNASVVTERRTNRGRLSSAPSNSASISSIRPTSIPMAQARRSSVGAAGLRPARRNRDRHQGSGAMRDGPIRAVFAQGDSREIDESLRRLGNRLRRSLSDSSLGPEHADRGNTGSAARCRSKAVKRGTSAHRRCMHGSSPRRCTWPRRSGWTRFVSMQNHYNLLYREEEREMMPSVGGPGRRYPVESAGARPPDESMQREGRDQTRRRR